MCLLNLIHGLLGILSGEYYQTFIYGDLKMLDLKKFCSNDFFQGGRFKAPFGDSNFTYAFAWSVLVRVPKVDGQNNLPEFEYDDFIQKCENSLDGVETLAYKPLINFPEIHYEECRVCEGTELVATVNKCKQCRGLGFTDTGDCKSCSGIGFVADMSKLHKCPECRGEKQLAYRLNYVPISDGVSTVRVDSVTVNLFSGFKDVMYAINEHGLVIKFDGGYGLIAKLKDEIQEAA